MKYDEAVRKLAQTYQAADNGEKTVAAVLFGIRYADEISGMDITRMSKDALDGKYMASRIRVGMKLAKWVTLKV